MSLTVMLAWRVSLNALLAEITLGVGVRLCGLKDEATNYM